MHWKQMPGWFRWRSGQDQATHHFAEGSRFVEVGSYLGRSLGSLAEVSAQSGKRFTSIGVDTCRGGDPELPSGKDYHGTCGYADAVALIVAESGRLAGVRNGHVLRNRLAPARAVRPPGVSARPGRRSARAWPSFRSCAEAWRPTWPPAARGGCRNSKRWPSS